MKKPLPGTILILLGKPFALCNKTNISILFFTLSLWSINISFNQSEFKLKERCTKQKNSITICHENGFLILYLHSELPNWKLKNRLIKEISLLYISLSSMTWRLYNESVTVLCICVCIVGYLSLTKQFGFLQKY